MKIVKNLYFVILKRLIFLFCILIVSNVPLVSNEQKSIVTIIFGETLASVTRIIEDQKIGNLKYYQNTNNEMQVNFLLVNNLVSKVNGILASQLLFSFDRENKLMTIGYFFKTFQEQKDAMGKIAPFKVVLEDGYGANYNEQYIVNASPQSGLYLISFIDRLRLRNHSYQRVDELITDIDKIYFNKLRPKEDVRDLILPGDNLDNAKNKIKLYNAQYEILPEGDLRVYRLGKTILSSWVSNQFVFLDSKSNRVSRVIYYFTELSEGVKFATSLPVFKKNSDLIKLIHSDAKFAATIESDIFVFAHAKSVESDEQENYIVYFIDIKQLKTQDSNGYKEIQDILEKTNKYIKELK